jgi:hypothetical protein
MKPIAERSLALAAAAWLSLTPSVATGQSFNEAWSRAKTQGRDPAVSVWTDDVFVPAVGRLFELCLTETRDKLCQGQSPVLRKGTLRAAAHVSETGAVTKAFARDPTGVGYCVVKKLEDFNFPVVPPRKIFAAVEFTIGNIPRKAFRPGTPECSAGAL